MRSFDAPGANAKVQVRTRDHCDPHVHAVNRPDRWEARVGFSYVEDTVFLMDITPVANEPHSGTIKRLLADVQANILKCRADWWRLYATTCLINKWVKVKRDG